MVIGKQMKTVRIHLLHIILESERIISRAKCVNRKIETTDGKSPQNYWR